MHSESTHKKASQKLQHLPSCNKFLQNYWGTDTPLGRNNLFSELKIWKKKSSKLKNIKRKQTKAFSKDSQKRSYLKALAFSKSAATVHKKGVNLTWFVLTNYCRNGKNNFCNCWREEYQPPQVQTHPKKAPFHCWLYVVPPEKNPKCQSLVYEVWGGALPTNWQLANKPWAWLTYNLDSHSTFCLRKGRPGGLQKGT